MPSLPSGPLPALGVMFFGATEADRSEDRYALVRGAAAAADRLGYTAVWTPERHFDAFGGLFPSPAVLGAALAAGTSRCQIRAGSVVAPLHDTLRIAEDWSVLDNLSGGGRVGISLGSGWNANDFVLAPDRYADRARRVQDAVTELRELWAGRPVERRNGSGRTVQVAVQPTPLSPELPLWLTASGNPATFEAAGRLGTNLLTHLLGQDLDTLRERIDRYRAARAEAGHQGPGTVTLMLHTYATRDADNGWKAARTPLRGYLRTALELELRASAGGGAVSGGREVSIPALPEAVIDELLEERARRFHREASLIGTPEKCLRMLERVGAAGVDEIACLVDFGLPLERVLDSLELLADTRYPGTDRTPADTDRTLAGTGTGSGTSTGTDARDAAVDRPLAEVAG
ncbi:siderophore biosynthesis protein [Kitasatospora xanthocidica]|uniref:MupA/Atu3671 family FMN-dependent luciferase-like monooxygenase n=1 Tax=Kitasatospora xanthocidica TaxID=83382 RepID=UPI001984742F|nr:MupA/Atu3671 family FMN-dependent luciferase-like monooxygenase [Kitasatospora xanthocidica]GHF53276.1 siderophore biosynthesis protein [Kitasatospora xanthocidica]